MRIVVFGAGGVGGYFGGVLARADHEVHVIARGAHLESINNQGLLVKSHHFGEFSARVQATADPKDVGEVDLVLFTVKTYQSGQAISLLGPLVGAETTILSLQNGVESCDQLKSASPDTHILPGAAYIEARIESPGTIVQRGEVVRIAFGERTGESTPRSRQILKTLEDAEIKTELSLDVMKTLWTKFVFIVALAGPTAAARAEMHQLLKLSEGRELVQTVVREAEAVGRAEGIALEKDIFEQTMSYIEDYAQDLHASMHTDLDRGRPLELDALNGAIVRLGRRRSVPVPVNQCIYALLGPYLQGIG